MGYDYYRTLDKPLAPLSCGILGSHDNWDLGCQFSRIQLNSSSIYVVQGIDVYATMHNYLLHQLNESSSSCAAAIRPLGEATQIGVTSAFEFTFRSTSMMHILFSAPSKRQSSARLRSTGRLGNASSCEYNVLTGQAANRGLSTKYST